KPEKGTAMKYLMPMVVIIGLATGLEAKPVEKNKKAVDPLINKLTGKSVKVRGQAANDLAALGEVAVPALVKVLKGKDENARGHACVALAKIGPAAKEAVPALVASLNEKKGSTVPANAALALGRIGKAAVGALAEALKSKEAHVREHAASALKDIGPDAREAIPALIVLAKDNKAGLARMFALDALGNIGA